MVMWLIPFEKVLGRDNQGLVIKDHRPEEGRDEEFDGEGDGEQGKSDIYANQHTTDNHIRLNLFTTSSMIAITSVRMVAIAPNTVKYYEEGRGWD